MFSLAMKVCVSYPNTRGDLHGLLFPRGLGMLYNLIMTKVICVNNPSSD